MVQIIDEIRKPSFSDQLFSGLSRASNEASTELPKFFGQRMLQERENEGLQRLTGQDFSGIPLELKKEFIKAHVTGKMQKQLEKENSLQIGLETIKRMRSLIRSAGPSNFIGGLFGGETTKNRAELEALGRSLIPLVAAGVPIRNQKEFEEYRKVITNPNARQAEFEGALNGLQDLFERSLGQSEVGEQRQEKKVKPKFNSKHPEHEAKARQLYKTFKDKERVRKELEKEFEF